jgi:bacterioferritin
MGKVGRSIIQGIEADEVITLLNKAYADEWLAYYQYFIEAKVVKGLMKDAVIAELNQHAADELRHATMVADRIIQLGGTPLLHPKDWLTHANCAYEAPTDADVFKVLEQAINGERCAIGVYSKLTEITNGKDIVTYNMASSILADEVTHEEDLQSLFEDIEGLIKTIRG